MATEPPSSGPTPQPVEPRRPWTEILLIAIVVVAVGFIAFDQLSRSSPSSKSEPVAAGIPAGTRQYEITSADHVQQAVRYPETPPAGGPHVGGWQNCGF